MITSRAFRPCAQSFHFLVITQRAEAVRLYFMGICGTAMGNVAVMLRKLGHEVSGSDEGIYPPMSDILSEAGVSIFEGYSVERLAELKPDRVVVGNVMSRGNPEIEWLLESRQLPFVSLPALLSELLLHERKALVVTGTHGKTTTATLAAYLLDANGAEPGYLIGGVPHDLPSGAHPGEVGKPFVIEGDEYDTAFFDKRSKFIHYCPRVVTVNNLEFDHADIFRDLPDVMRTFNHLLRIIPRDGCIVLNGDDENIAQLAPTPWVERWTVGVAPANDLVITDFEETKEGSCFTLIWRGREWGQVRWSLTGLFNARNAAIAALASARLVSPEDPTQFSLAALAGFCGVKRRQEKLFSNELLEVLEDFGHHPTAIRETLVSLRNCYPGYRLNVCFEPRSNTARTAIFQQEFTEALSGADSVLIGAVGCIEKMDPTNRIDTRMMSDELQQHGLAAEAFSENEVLLEYLQQHLRESSGKQLVCFFSNGAFGGVMRKLVDSLTNS